MKLVQINITCGSGSTGKICVAVSERLTERGVENYILYSSGDSDYPLGRKYMKPVEIKMQALYSRILGNYGFNAKGATRKLISVLEEIQPDIVHLHNLHGHNCNLQMLFTYLKEKKIKIFWTFHDCWAFTGYCPYYDIVGCGQWKTSCGNCPQRRKYSWFLDRSHDMFEKKKRLFTDLDLTIITPSHWLAEQVKQSFLHNKEIKVIHNGIDLSVFKPTESDFRMRYGCKDKYIVLGVAFDWGPRKGLDVFCELAGRLDSRYQIVLVGTNDTVDNALPENIISIHRTQNQTELAAIYTAADLFVNPTREDTYPTTQMEAIACGTPVIAFNTGGCAEMLSETCGRVVDKNDINALFEQIEKNCGLKKYTTEQCLTKAQEYSSHVAYGKYVNVYLNNSKWEA